MESERNKRSDMTKESLPEELRSQGIVARDPHSLKLFSDALLIAPTQPNVLIVGESGTGKGLLARFLHDHSPRRDKPFVHVNCSAIPAELFEAEFFGYESGTFTGQLADSKKGLVSQAAGGSLFLDEIGDLTPSLQAKLLQVIQEHQVRSLGSTLAKELDIRLIAATNRDLASMVQSGRFRLDLYYRLNVVTLEIPPLRQRRQDVKELLEVLSERYAAKGSDKKTFLPDAVAWLQEQDWPGNIREMQNFMERLYVLETRTELDADYLKERYHFPAFRTASAPPEPNILPLSAAVARFEREYIASVLQKTPNMMAAASILGVDVSLLNRKLRQ